MKKKILLPEILLLSIALLTGCGSQTTAGTEDATPPIESEDSADTPEELTPADTTSLNSITQLAIDVPVEINGKELTVTTAPAYPDDEEILAVTAKYGDQELKVDESLGIRNIYQVEQDDENYVMVETYNYNDYSITYLLKLDETGITQTDTRDGSINEVPANPEDGFAITSKVDVLGTYGGTRTYTIENDRFTTDSTLYEFRGTPDGYKPTLTVKSAIPCRIEGGSTELKPGEAITPTGYSEDGTFYFEKADGTPGSIQVDLDEEEHYAGTIGGVNEYDLFETLPYAG